MPPAAARSPVPNARIATARQRAAWLLLGLMALSVLLAGLGASVGSTGFDSVLRVADDPLAARIVWDIRLPRSLGAWLAGALLGLAVGVLLVIRLLWTKGKAAFPPAPDSDLPSVLKALHVQQRFAFFAEAVQGMDADALHASFGQWLSGVRPADPESPTQAPGVIRSDGVQLEMPELVADKQVDAEGKAVVL